MILYHGSNQKVDNIDLGKSRPSKDFGLAFYLSEDIEQAKEMAQFKLILLAENSLLINLNLILIKLLVTI